MVIAKKGDCEHCGRFYRYTLWHSGFGDNSYAYCDACGMLGILNYLNPHVAGFPPLTQQYAEIETSWEPFLEPCACGGHFRRGEATGAGRGWQWQRNWSGVYCMAMDDPQAPGRPRQMINPVIKSEVAKTRSRWSLLFSFGR